VMVTCDGSTGTTTPMGVIDVTTLTEDARRACLASSNVLAHLSLGSVCFQINTRKIEQGVRIQPLCCRCESTSHVIAFSPTFLEPDAKEKAPV
jgi:hypothetical protein